MSFRRRALIVVAVAAAGLLPAAPAQAHAVPLGSDPGDGAVLQAPPSEVVLRFNELVELPPEPLRVFDADGARVEIPASVDEWGDLDEPAPYVINNLAGNGSDSHGDTTDDTDEVDAGTDDDAGEPQPVAATDDGTGPLPVIALTPGCSASAPASPRYWWRSGPPAAPRRSQPRTPYRRRSRRKARD